jgi:hypothetical protein
MDSLTRKEKELIELKLDRQEGESLQDAIERLVQGDNAEETAVNLQSLINFVDALAAHPRCWEQVSSISGILYQGLNPNTQQLQSSVITFRVRDKEEFLKALQAVGYDVNTLIERVRIRAGKVRRNFKTIIKAAIRGRRPTITTLPSHPYDNARQPTRRIRDPQLHIYNEFGDTDFWAHWDVGSSNTGKRIIDPIGAAWHGYFASPDEVAKRLERLE